MRKYYIFLIDSYVIDSYINDPASLYKTLKKVYSSRMNMKYRVSIFKQITKMIEKTVITNYIENKFNSYKKNKDKYLLNINDEKCLVEINYSCVVLYTNKNFSNIFDILKIYNKNFFVCDFKNEDYFFINKISNKVFKNNI